MFVFDALSGGLGSFFLLIFSLIILLVVLLPLHGALSRERRLFLICQGIHCLVILNHLFDIELAVSLYNVIQLLLKFQLQNSFLLYCILLLKMIGNP